MWHMCSKRILCDRTGRFLISSFVLQPVRSICLLFMVLIATLGAIICQSFSPSLVLSSHSSSCSTFFTSLTRNTHSPPALTHTLTPIHHHFHNLNDPPNDQQPADTVKTRNFPRTCFGRVLLPPSPPPSLFSSLLSSSSWHQSLSSLHPTPSVSPSSNPLPNRHHRRTLPSHNSNILSNHQVTTITILNF